MKAVLGLAFAMAITGTQAGAVTVSFTNVVNRQPVIEFEGQITGEDLNSDGLISLSEAVSGFVRMGQYLNPDFQFFHALNQFTALSIPLSGLFGDSPSEFLVSSNPGYTDTGCHGEPIQISDSMDFRSGTVAFDFSGYSGRYCMETGYAADIDVGPVWIVDSLANPQVVPLPASGLMLLAALPLLRLRRRRKA